MEQGAQIPAYQRAGLSKSMLIKELAYQRASLSKSWLIKELAYQRAGLSESSGRSTITASPCGSLISGMTTAATGSVLTEMRTGNSMPLVRCSDASLGSMICRSMRPTGNTTGRSGAPHDHPDLSDLRLCLATFGRRVSGSATCAARLNSWASLLPASAATRASSTTGPGCAGTRKPRRS